MNSREHSLFLFNQMWDRLTTESNRYAAQQRTAHPPTPSTSAWRDFEKTDMHAFIGLCFSMRFLRLPRRHHYWRTTKWMLTTKFPSVMSRNKFDFMWRYLHLQDNTAPVPAGEKVWKLRWFLNHLNTRFQEAYTPYGHCTIDESMVKFKGRLSFRQYMPAKPIKWCIKVWVLCESDTGYAYNMQVYTGKVAGRQEKGMAHCVCMDLLVPVLGTNLSVYMDNLYTSVGLLNDLRVRGVLACGTVRSNRKGLPAAVLPRTYISSGVSSRWPRKTTSHVLSGWTLNLSSRCPTFMTQLSKAQCCDAGMGCALRCLYQRCCRTTSSTCAE